MNELAERVRQAAAGVGIAVDIQHIENPRKEQEEHYYNPAHRGLQDFGLQPHLLTDQVLAEMLGSCARAPRSHCRPDRILPRVRWR